MPRVVSQGLKRVREAARRDTGIRFTSLLHHVKEELLKEAYYALNRKATPGVDGMRWEEYGEGLEARLNGLHGRMHRHRFYGGSLFNTPCNRRCNSYKSAHE